MERKDAMVGSRLLVVTAVMVVALLQSALTVLGAGTADDKKSTGTKPAAVVSTETGKGFTDPTTGMEFVLVPGGCFRMGDTYGDGQGDEKPVHDVCVSDFSMGKFEVTNAQFRKFRPDHDSGSYEGNSLNEDNQPVANVSWYDAAEYAQWLSKKSGRSYRLPTEAEWEYAARGGFPGRNYWGDNPADACFFANGADLTAKSQWPDWTTTQCNDGYKVAAPVGRFRPNAFGIYDIMGNAWEWTNDWYDSEYYFNSPRNNPRGPATGRLKIPRGGGWGNASECVRVSDRNGFAPDFHILFLGFRLVSTNR